MQGKAPAIAGVFFVFPQKKTGGKTPERRQKRRARFSVVTCDLDEYLRSCGESNQEQMFLERHDKLRHRKQ
jgi:hypothetical protein